MKNLILIFSILCFFSCKKNEVKAPIEFPVLNEPIDSTGKLDLHITNVVNGSPLALGTATYTNFNGDQYTVSTLRYYISNIQLTTTDNIVYKQKESYYLTDQSDLASLELLVTKVPQGNYKSISFLIGVDSVRNFSGAQVGALDPANGMIWSWSTGYIMEKMEGTSPQSSEITKNVAFHIGGFSGEYTGVKKVDLSFPINAEVRKSHTPTINMNADLALWFGNENIIDFSATPSITTVGKNSSKIAVNYAKMFQIISVIN